MAKQAAESRAAMAGRARAGRWFGYVADVSCVGVVQANGEGLLPVPGVGLVDPTDGDGAGFLFSRGFPAWGAAVRWVCGQLSERRQAAYDRFRLWDRALRLAERAPVDGAAWELPEGDE